jgi:ABC-type Zn2+ transport system substrate-binding protein/surface adhesin
VEHHATDDHGDDHGHDDHAHQDEGAALGPIDVYAWGAGVLGVVIGAVIAICFAAATASPT